MQNKGLDTMKLGLALLLVLIAVACGGSDDESDDGGNGEVGETVSAIITAEGGGTVSLPSGAASIEIPAGALGEDMEITITALAKEDAPEAESLGSLVFDLGPDGTTFAEPAMLTLKADSSAPEGKKAVLAWLDGESWSILPGSEVSGESVSAPVSHFSRFVVYFTDEGTVIENTDEICQDLSFSPCGGDVVGSWVVEAYCIEPRTMSDEDNPFEEIPECADNNHVSMSVDIEWTGEITFNEDGTYTENFGNKATAVTTMDDTCLEGIAAAYGSEAAGMTNEEICLQLGSMMTDSSDAETDVRYEDGACVIEMLIRDEPGESSDGEWHVDGTGMYFAHGSLDEEGEPYCVEGDQTIVELTSEEDTNDDGEDDTTYTDHLVLKRQ